MGKSEGLQGRLQFYTTFFETTKNKNLIDYVMINPHDRKLRYSKSGPIIIEAVPSGVCGTVQILYFPYDLMMEYNESQQKLDSSKNIFSEVIADLELILEGFHDLLTLYGISAKGKAGFGKCKNIKAEIFDNILNEEVKNQLLSTFQKNKTQQQEVK